MVGAAGRLLHYVLARLIRREDSNRLIPFLRPVRWPVSLFLGLMLFNVIALPVLDFPQQALDTIEEFLVILVVIALTWFLIGLIQGANNMIDATYGRHLREHSAARSRAFSTQMTVLRRVLIITVALVGSMLALSQFEVFRTMGAYLLASAGVAGIVLGLAAQRTLGNVLAGIQVAIAQPVRLDDIVLFQDDYGYIEEIGFTFVVIRTWDKRRLIVPVNYLLEHPLQNWSRRSTEIIGTVAIYVDYRTDVGWLRKTFEEIMERQEEWNRSVPAKLQVIDATERTMLVRGLCSADDPPIAWDLRCRVREEMVAALQAHEGGRFLARERLEIERTEAGEKLYPQQRAEPDHGGYAVVAQGDAQEGEQGER